MEQLPTKPLLVLGENPISTALRFTLSLHCGHCEHYAQIPTSFSTQPSLILSVIPHDIVIKQVRQLRSRLMWEGTFAAIVHSPAEKEKLQKLSMFGEPDGNPSYQDIPGHFVLSSTSPSLISDILSLYQKSNNKRIRHNAWKGLLGRSSFSHLLNQVHSSGNTERDDLIIGARILDDLHSYNIDWRSLISHEHFRYIKEVQSKYPPGIKTKDNEVSDILENLRKMFHDEVSSYG
jgi:hypothetical protein